MLQQACQRELLEVSKKDSHSDAEIHLVKARSAQEENLSAHHSFWQLCQASRSIMRD